MLDASRCRTAQILFSLLARHIIYLLEDHVRLAKEKLLLLKNEGTNFLLRLFREHGHTLVDAGTSVAWDRADEACSPGHCIRDGGDYSEKPARFESRGDAAGI